MSRKPPTPPDANRNCAGSTVSHRPAYDRRRDLPALIAVWPSEIDDTTRCGRISLLAKLRRALRAERRRGLAGHWTYDLARHAQLLTAYRHELAAAGRIVSGSNAGSQRAPTKA